MTVGLLNHWIFLKKTGISKLLLPIVLKTNFESILHLHEIIIICYYQNIVINFPLNHWRKHIN